MSASIVSSFLLLTLRLHKSIFVNYVKKKTIRMLSISMSSHGTRCIYTTILVFFNLLNVPIICNVCYPYLALFSYSEYDLVANICIDRGTCRVYNTENVLATFPLFG